MVHIDYFDIVFDKQNPIYFPGEFLSGKVILKLSDKLKINSLRLLLKGDAKVNLLKDQMSNDDSKPHHAHDSENYFHLDLAILDKETEIIQIGNHEYPFSIKLSDNLPSTFQHENGKIQYSVKALIDIPWAFDKEVKKYFVIMSQVDLNEFPGLNELKTIAEDKYLGFGLFKSKPIKVTFTLEKTGFVPGENMVFTASIQNETSRDILDIKVIFVQNCKFTIKDESVTYSRKMCKTDFCKQVGAKSSERWTSSSLIIPQVCPTSNGTCSLIDVSYELMLKFETTGISKSRKLSIPIVIGTIPFNN